MCSTTPAPVVLVFFFNDTATTEIYTLSLHDALPILRYPTNNPPITPSPPGAAHASDRKSTRLNSSHLVISYAVFCLKKNNKALDPITPQPSARTDPPYYNCDISA